MVHDYPLERTLASCAQLMKEISSVRSELQTNAETLNDMMQHHSVLEASKKRLAELTKHERTMAKRSASLSDAKRIEEARVKDLSRQLASLAKQTEMTELYLNMLDHEIEDALRQEEGEERARVQQDLIKKKKKKAIKKTHIQVLEGLPATQDEEGALDEGDEEEEEEPWTREEEVEYLQLQSAQELLRGELKQLSLRVDDQRVELRAMLDTLDEGETAVIGKRAECEKLEDEAERWRQELERLLQASALSLPNQMQ